jgi:hypothetical protein
MSEYDRQGNPITFEQSTALFADFGSRRVDKTDVSEDVSVSTVHLVIDHAWDDGPPLIFETMIFGGEHDQWCDRYSTEEEAQAGHNAVVAWLSGQGSEPGARLV